MSTEPVDHELGKFNTIYKLYVPYSPVGSVIFKKVIYYGKIVLF